VDAATITAIASGLAVVLKAVAEVVKAVRARRARCALHDEAGAERVEV
jgi:hypothetical protein